MAKDWQELTKLTRDEPLVIEKVKLTKSDILIEGEFDLPPLARLTMEDQIFVAAFIKSHGSIKEMENLFGVSYPTINGRLNRIASRLDFVEIEKVTPRNETLERLEQGEISAREAIEMLQRKNGD